MEIAVDKPPGRQDGHFPCQSTKPPGSVENVQKDMEKEIQWAEQNHVEGIFKRAVVRDSDAGLILLGSLSARYMCLRPLLLTRRLPTPGRSLITSML